MFGSDKKQGFLTGTPGGAVTRTPTKSVAPVQPGSMMPRPPAPVAPSAGTPKPIPTPAASGPVTSLPNPVVGGNPRQAPRTKPETMAATKVPTRTRSIPGVGQASMTGSKSNYGTVRHGQGVRSATPNGIKAQSPGKGLWSKLTSQMAPGKWFSN